MPEAALTSAATAIKSVAICFSEVSSDLIGVVGDDKVLEMLLADRVMGVKDDRLGRLKALEVAEIEADVLDTKQGVIADKAGRVTLLPTGTSGFGGVEATVLTIEVSINPSEDIVAAVCVKAAFCRSCRMLLFSIRA